MPNWATTGLDWIHAFWLKRLTSQHQSLAEVMNGNIQSLSIPSWLVKSRTVLIQKCPANGNDLGNFEPIACLNLLRKLKTGIIADNLYQHLENENLILEEHKGCRHFFKGTKDQLLIRLSSGIVKGGKQI